MGRMVRSIAAKKRAGFLFPLLLLSLGLLILVYRVLWTGDPGSIVWYGPPSHPHLSELLDGVDSAETRTGVPILRVTNSIWSAGRESDPPGFPGGRHQAYSLCPEDPLEANVLFSSLKKRGRIVVAYGKEPVLPTPAAFTVGTDFYKAATAAGEYLVESIGGSGSLLHLYGEDDHEGARQKKALAEVVSKFPDVHMTQELAGLTELPSAVLQIQNILFARGQALDGIIATGEMATQAAVEALSNWYEDPESRRIRFVGLGTDSNVLEAVDSGMIDATLAENHFAQGYLSCLLLARMIRGWVPYRPYVFIDTGTVLVRRKNVFFFQEEIWSYTDELSDDIEKKYLRPPK